MKAEDCNIFDIVVGNNKAHYYRTTKSGWYGMILAIRSPRYTGQTELIRVQQVDPVNFNFTKNTTAYWVDPDKFDIFRRHSYGNYKLKYSIC